MSTWIGPYEVLSEIARGGAGVVFQARDPAGREAAVKVMTDVEGAQATRALIRQSRELEALKRLRHPNLVRVLDAGDDGRPWIAMELIEGPSLDSRLQTKTFTPSAAADLVRQLALGVEHAHQAGVLHRDIKPENVLLARNGTPQLTDFGLAKLFKNQALTQVSHSGACQGTPGYWPPEQARGELELIGPGADVYGLGATLYALLTGQAPFERDSLLASVLATCEADPEPPSLHAKVDRALDAICLRCLEKAPADRYPSAQALADELDRYLNGAAVSPPTANPSGLAPVAVVVVLLGAAAALGFVAGSGRPAKLADDVSDVTPDDHEATDPAKEPTPPPEYLEPRQPPHVPEETTPEDTQPPEPRARALLLADLERAQALQAEDPQQALALMDRLIQEDPTFVRARILRGHLLRTQGQSERALVEFEALAKEYPERHGHWINCAIVRMELGDLEGALADSERALALKPDDATILFNRGVIRGELGDLEGALADHDAAVKLNPYDALAWTNRGTAKEMLGDLEGARDDHTRSLELDPEDGGAYFNRGVVIMKLGDTDGAVRDLNRALRLGVVKPQLHAALGATYTLRGELGAARDSYERALKLDPAFHVGWYNLACLDAREGNHRAARASLSRAVDTGYANADHMRRDPDLESVRALPWFAPLVERAEANASRSPGRASPDK